MNVNLTVEKKYTIVVSGDLEMWKDVMPVLTEAITKEGRWTHEQLITLNALRQALADRLREAGAW